MPSQFSRKFSRPSAITTLMEDLNQGVRDPNSLMLGGGNPAQIPEVKSRLQNYLESAVADGALLEAVSNYDGPLGSDSFRDALAGLLSDYFGTGVTPQHIALTNGSQSAFFALANLFAGRRADGSLKKILLPMSPEYIGYSDLGVNDDLFISHPAKITLLPDREFKYQIDFDRFVLDDSIGMVLTSCPTNPTGNMLTDSELAELDSRCQQAGVPLLLDCAYGAPFPNILFEDTRLPFNDNIILCLSLSKLGLPGVRCGIVVAAPELISRMANLAGVISLAPGSLGPVITEPMVRSGEILRLSTEVIRPYYKEKSAIMMKALKQAIPDPRFRIHKSEGAIFLWLWFDGLSISSQQLYEKLKNRGLIVVAGHHFFPGISEQSDHINACIRVSYAQPNEVLQQAIKILSEEVNPLYEEQP
ncbi:valine--pyruvate transaminase [Corallincola platygyrae]|uniref:Valine--pyruvate transaminase n=1 Tax=Corallincola platygyrae TaxID=1193278 RepID=A0ABW4XNQ8_9GAMM